MQDLLTKNSQACGKCVLFGEHSILYGASAITLPLKKLQLKIKFKASQTRRLILEATQQYPQSEELFWKLLETDFSDLPFEGEYTVQSEIPLGADWDPRQLYLSLFTACTDPASASMSSSNVPGKAKIFFTVKALEWILAPLPPKNRFASKM